MSNVLVDKTKLDYLANAISNKSGEALTLTLDEMVSAVDGIEVGGGGITPTGNIDITSAGTTDVTNYATATVPSASVGLTVYSQFITESGNRKYQYRAEAETDGDNGWYEGGVGSWRTTNAISTGTSVTPTESSQTIGGANTMLEGAVTVNAIPSNYVGSGITQRDSTDLSANGATVTAPSGYYASSANKSIGNASLSQPTNIIETSARISTSSNNTLILAKDNITITPNISSSGYISTPLTDYISGSTNLQLRATCDINPTPTASGATVTTPVGYYSQAQTTTVSSGTAGTPTATKGAVNNHSIAVTPSVTNTTGYITGSTINGTAVSVSASELVSGNLPITQNGDNIDVTNYATVSVNVSGGGGSGVAVDLIGTNFFASAGALTFTDLLGEPTSFYIQIEDSTAITPTANSNVAVAVVYDATTGGTSAYKTMLITNTSNAQVTYMNGDVYHNYSNGTLEVNILGQNNMFSTTANYSLLYSYGGTSANVFTQDVQVGSGATSISFTNLEDEPMYYSVIFKSNFSTSSGYQRVISTAMLDDAPYGMEMDSSAHFSDAHWSWTYNNGTLTVTSQGTNAGGYFHQPGYYQLTYVVDGDQSLQTKTVTPTTSTQNVTADTGYTALKKVVVNPIPSSYVQPTATKGATTYTPTTSNQTIASGTYLTGTQTISGDANLVAGNIKSGTSIFGVTGTYSGGGGTDRLVLLQTTSLGSLSTSSTSGTDTGKTVSLAQSTGWQNYDLLLVDISVDTKTNGRHTSTVTPVILTGTSNVNTKNTYTVGSNKWNSKLGSTGTASSRQSTTAYGIYVNSASVSSSTLTMPLYYRYNNNSTGILNGTYTARVYGIKLIDLIGG